MSVKGRKKGVIVNAVKICAFCNKEFVVYGRKRIVVAKFCSRTCASRWQKEHKPHKSNKVEKVCDNCGAIFSVWKHETVTRIDASGRKRNAPRFCNTRCKKEYFFRNTRDISVLRERAYDRDQGRCVDCGGRRYLETHHIDGIKTHNTLENLATLCKKCHVRRHVILNSGINHNGTFSKTYNS